MSISTLITFAAIVVLFFLPIILLDVLVFRLKGSNKSILLGIATTLLLFITISCTFVIKYWDIRNSLPSIIYLTVFFILSEYLINAIFLFTIVFIRTIVSLFQEVFAKIKKCRQKMKKIKKSKREIIVSSSPKVHPGQIYINKDGVPDIY